MDGQILFGDFDEASHRSRQSKEPRAARFTDTYKWEEHGIELKKVLSRTMLVTELENSTKSLEGGRGVRVQVHACYNWTLKREFILVEKEDFEKFTYHTPQYGRDNNQATRTRRDTKYMGFSVEAFNEKEPELAKCLMGL
jgi:hypothetical protein